MTHFSITIYVTHLRDVLLSFDNPITYIGCVIPTQNNIHFVLRTHLNNISDNTAMDITHVITSATHMQYVL